MKVGDVMNAPGFGEHPDDDPKETAEFWHNPILSMRRAHCSQLASGSMLNEQGDPAKRTNR